MSLKPALAPPAVGISRCLLGEPVRYDGGHRHQPALVAALSQHFHLVAICPETEAGLGVPRPAVQLVQQSDEIRACGVADAELDVSTALVDCAVRHRAQLEGLHGFVFKARSPSCGVGSTPLHGEQGEVVGSTSGLFAARVQAWLPRLPLAEETQLVDAAACEDFIARVWAYYRGE